MKFQWDEIKNRKNKKKHDVSFQQACLVFADENALTIFDDDHSDSEDRWITLGRILSDNIILVVHTYRIKKDTEIIRIISARKATKKEQEQYFRENR